MSVFGSLTNNAQGRGGCELSGEAEWKLDCSLVTFRAASWATGWGNPDPRLGLLGGVLEEMQFLRQGRGIMFKTLMWPVPS